VAVTPGAELWDETSLFLDNSFRGVGHGVKKGVADGHRTPTGRRGVGHGGP
jgi:hypothetical protein